MKANEIKRGTVINHDGRPVIIKQLHVQTACSRSGNTLYKVKGRELVSGQKYENSFKGDEVVQTVDVERRAIQMLYRDGEGCTFMDTESYEQYTVADTLLEDELNYLTDGLEGISALISEGVLLSIELPSSIVLQVTECAPGLKTASSSARTKPATLSTGLVIQVPEYLAEGERVKVNTETGEYVSRVQQE